MPYTVSQIKVFAYNKQEPPDATEEEATLYRCLRYCYDLHRAGYEQKDIEPIMAGYIEYFEFLKWQKEQNEQKGGD